MASAAKILDTVHLAARDVSRLPDSMSITPEKRNSWKTSIDDNFEATQTKIMDPADSTL